VPQRSQPIGGNLHADPLWQWFAFMANGNLYIAYSSKDDGTRPLDGGTEFWFAEGAELHINRGARDPMAYDKEGKADFYSADPLGDEHFCCLNVHVTTML
jgi:hypothetical protein